ncbi:carotenoid oxygenase [Emericellopsis cladophorae]|uniref:Carotenoid oxygenase n=1 Tax=Emericellopsis cladophorae TaxID=2686198 RepID=A0A9P9Y6U8_9HYPO|nr:carotenoid oxygenase [Emericellopsis cladophorae]KAI6784556.1 carotenoid oxygenase [Emericellopsis cladophorae]
MPHDKKPRHPYLSGNFAPIHSTLPLTPCAYEGEIPLDLAGGQYVRNGANPVTNEDLGRDAHWFDGDGMLAGVLFQRRTQRADDGSGSVEAIEPHFVNQYLLTDVYCYAKHNQSLARPLLPSIATLVSPASALLHVMWSIFRAVALAMVSRFPGRPTIRKISVANTNVVYHDGRALATCESGPPLRFLLPTLETIGWYNGRRAQREEDADERSGFGGEGPMAFMREWMTAHPRVDPVSKELIAFHSTFAKPYVRYSIVKPSISKEATPPSTFDQPVPGISSPKMMHDFGVSSHHTVIMDLPLVLDPMNQMRGLPPLHYDSSSRSRFGVFPRYAPHQVKWFETNPCLIFHTANCWDTTTLMNKATMQRDTVVNLLACRLTSAATVFNPANIASPEVKAVQPEYAEEEQCRLYYYAFPLSESQVQIRHQWALSAIPFEFPVVAADRAMGECRYVYGCTTSKSFTVALGKAAKIDYLSKIDVRTLIARGVEKPPQTIKGSVDTRNVQQVVASKDPHDPIQLFAMPPGWYAQEPRFVPRTTDGGREDDGWLLFYAFDEAQLDAQDKAGDDATSELWIVDARTMKDVVAKIKLPQRVPYGLHGAWFSEDEIRGQRPHEGVRALGAISAAKAADSLVGQVRDRLERWLG